MRCQKVRERERIKSEVIGVKISFRIQMCWQGCKNFEWQNIPQSPVTEAFFAWVPVQNRSRSEDASFRKNMKKRVKFAVTGGLWRKHQMLSENWVICQHWHRLFFQYVWASVLFIKIEEKSWEIHIMIRVARTVRCSRNTASCSSRCSSFISAAYGQLAGHSSGRAKMSYGGCFWCKNRWLVKPMVEPW